MDGIHIRKGVRIPKPTNYDVRADRINLIHSFQQNTKIEIDLYQFDKMLSKKLKLPLAILSKKDLNRTSTFQITVD